MRTSGCEKIIESSVSPCLAKATDRICNDSDCRGLTFYISESKTAFKLVTLLIQPFITLPGGFTLIYHYGLFAGPFTQIYAGVHISAEIREEQHSRKLKGSIDKLDILRMWCLLLYIRLSSARLFLFHPF